MGFAYMGKQKILLNFFLFLFIPVMLRSCNASVQNIGSLRTGFTGSQMFWIDNDGLFLVSNNSDFAFGFTNKKNVTDFLLAVIHQSSSTIIWTANRGAPVRIADAFVFDDTGNCYLRRGETLIWSSGTGNKGVSVMNLMNSGNLVLAGEDGSVVWQSFSHPTDTLLSNQEFFAGMKLVSEPGPYNLNYSLEIKSGDIVLSAGFDPPQSYWSMSRDDRRTVNRNVNGVNSAVITSNSWKFYDSKKVLLWQFIFSEGVNGNGTWLAVLGSDGLITFNLLQSGSTSPALTRIPQDSCSRPAACDPYYICYPGNKCQCPSSLPSCKPETFPRCNEHSVDLVSGGDELSYFAIKFVEPFSKTTLTGCKDACLGNCSCSVMFFEIGSGNCFLFNQIGTMDGSTSTARYASFIKISKSGGVEGKSEKGGNKHLILTVVIVILSILIIFVLIVCGYRFYRKGKQDPEFVEANSDEDNFFEALSGMPVRYTYKDMQKATNDFSVKLGQGGFGSVYRGVLPDGTQLAVKKLEGIGQGKKEFRAEVSIIGSIHHLHLVRLKGFCAEGVHRLLVYEFMANGSLEKWLFKKDKERFLLDWDTRFNIAVGTAKGLAYLHEDCDKKIVHCDIKPENVLLDDQFSAKVSDFGLAKLMTRDQSHVFTQLRGTRGYLAPEWITNYAISEKSDVYSYGMVLLELIGGRKNYDPNENSEKAFFPSYAFKMMEEGKLIDIIDSSMKIDVKDERVDLAIKVALWCIQDDMQMRPSMTKVVQMLDGLCTVTLPPMASPLGFRLHSTFWKTNSGEGTSSGPSDCNSATYVSAVRLSGPR